MRRFLVALTAILTLSGCAQVNHSQQRLLVSITNKFTSIQVGSAPVTLNAAVANEISHKGVKWGLSIASASCSPACGTLVPVGSTSYSAVYTPPSVAPANQTATITAESIEDSSQIFVFNFTIIPGVSVTISNKFATQIAGGAPVTVTAVVANDSANAGVTWTLTAGGANCSPACGTLAPPPAPTVTAVYTPPSTVPTGANASPTITATSVSKTSATDSFTFTIVSANTLLKGNFAFLLRGYDVTGSPMAMVGSVAADGQGSITAGELDINNGGGVTSVPTLSGTYSIDPSFNGVTRGTITISSFTFPGSTNHIVLKFVLSADGKRGSMVELDGSGFRNAGTFQVQDSSALSAANAAGTYAFGLDSDAPVGGRTVAAGQFVLSAIGITGGVVDESKAGDPTPRYVAAPIVAGPATKPDSNGRGTLTLTVNANATQDSTQYAYYVVSSQQLNLIEIDQGLKFGTVQAGIAQQQKALTANSVNTISILQLTGMDSPSGTNNIGPAVIIGQMKISGGATFNLNFDSNDLGTILTNHPASGAVASFDPSTGRGTLAAPGIGFNSGFVDLAVFYLSDTGSGFLIDADPSTPNGTPPNLATTNNAYSGTLIPQASGPFNVQNLSGNLVVLSGASAIPNIPNIAAGVNLVPPAAGQSAGTLTGAGDLTSQDTQVGNVPNISFTGKFQLVDPNLGYGFAQLPAGFFGDFASTQNDSAAFYMIGSTQFVLIGRQNGTFSGVSVFVPQ